MPANRINAEFLAEQREKFKTGFAMIAEALPFLIDLTTQQRAEMTKFGEKNRSFVVKSLALAEVHPEILPDSFDLAIRFVRKAAKKPAPPPSSG